MLTVGANLSNICMAMSKTAHRQYVVHLVKSGLYYPHPTKSTKQKFI